MKKLLLFCLSLLLIPGASQAVTITFDDITIASSGDIPGGYQGFVWEAYDPLADTVGGNVTVSTSNNATVSGSYALGSTLGFQISRQDGMTFNALDFMAAFESTGLTSDLAISGFKSGSLTQQLTTALFSSTATSIAVNFLDIDLLRIASPSIDVFSLDDLVVTAVPVPPAFWLFASGLLGLVRMAGKKKAA